MIVGEIGVEFCFLICGGYGERKFGEFFVLNRIFVNCEVNIFLGEW